MRRIFSSKDKSKKTRKEIEAEAFAQMRKAKASIDPGVLAKVRAAIKNSPMAAQLMGNVYADSDEEISKAEKKEAVKPPVKQKPLSETPKPAQVQEESIKEMPVRADVDKAKTERAILAAKKAHASIKDVEEEPVDQAKMLDVVAKMLELNPHKAGLKQGVKDILSDK